jgi:hypothetical protein
MRIMSVKGADLVIKKDTTIKVDTPHSFLLSPPIRTWEKPKRSQV